MKYLHYVLPSLLFCLSLSCASPNRFEPEIRAFETQDLADGYQKDFVLFTGSSSIRLWHSLQEDMGGIPVLNRGFGGATLHELNLHWDRIAGEHQPRLVVLYCGENDLAEGASSAETLAHFDVFLKKYEGTFAEVPLIYIAMKPSPSRFSLWPVFQLTDQKIKDRLEASPAYHFIDLSPTMMDTLGRLTPEIFEADSLHMNALGYQRWTQKLRPLMDKVMDQQTNYFFE